MTGDPRSGEHLTDRELLAEEYGDDSSLRSRQSIYAFTETAPAMDEVLDRLPVPPAGTLVDVGCGNGMWAVGMRVRHPAAAVVGLDRHAGMLGAVEGSGPPGGLLVADAHDLPFPGHSADAVMALWMLYHLVDLPTGLGEIRRILRPEGTLLAVTNRSEHLAELHELLDVALERHTGRPVPAGRLTGNFDGSNGQTILARTFDEVEVLDLDGSLRVTEADAVVTYVESLRLALDLRLDVDVPWPAVLADVGEAARDRIEADGALRITTASVAYYARGVA